MLIEIISVSTPPTLSVREVVEETAMSDVDQLTVDPTIEVEEGLTPTETRLCPGCGKPEALWRGNLGMGHLDDDGHTYCCMGCARQTGCTCT
jgi:hypothetical protein